MIKTTLHARHTLLGLLTMVALMVPVWSHAKVQMLDRIVAVVNDGAIMASELDERINTIALQFQEKGQPLPPPAVMREQVLDRMILERLQLQLADRAGIKVDDATLNQALAGIARQNGMTREDLAGALRQDGYNWAQFREQIREDMLISRLQQRSVASRIRITDREGPFPELGNGQANVRSRFSSGAHPGVCRCQPGGGAGRPPEGRRHCGTAEQG